MDYFEHANYRKSVRTTYQLEQASLAIREGFHSITGFYPSNDSVAKLLAQSRLETGHFQSCWNHNWGNVKRHPDNGTFHMIRCNEMINGVYEWFDPPHIQCCFAAYDSQEEGAIAWMKLIITGSRYVRAYQKLIDPESSSYDFCWMLGICGYYTADKHHYSSVAQNLYSSSLDAICRALGQEPPKKPRNLRLTKPEMEGEDVKSWKKNLRKVYGSQESELNDKFDEETEALTKKFQKKHGLVVDGIVGPASISTMEYVLNNIPQLDRYLKVTKPMMKGSDVTGWQQDLKKLNYNINVDGWFGQITEGVTKQFQSDNDLAVDGIVGPNTYDKMQSLLKEVGLF